MAIDRFSRERFEAALPKRKPVGDAPAEALARPLGIVQGEYCYIIQPYERIPVGLFIRSSVDGSGQAADTGEDSIRVLWCELLEGGAYRIIGNKAKAYTKRVNGWEDRLTKLLRKLANAIRFCLPCPNKCGARLVPFTTKNGDNAGRCFVNCPKCRNGDKSAVFFWCEDESEKPLDLPPELAPQKRKPDAPPPVVCPNCQTSEAVGLSKYPQNGSHHCFRSRKGCGHSWTPGENDGLTTPAHAPQATNAPASVPTPAQNERPAERKPDAKNAPTYNPQPPTLAELVEAVEDMRDALHSADDSPELVVMLRTHPTCARVASLVQQFHSAQPASAPPKQKRKTATA